MISVREKAEKTKRKRVSKKLKRSWRKHVDITDVDNFLEDQRLTERLGDYAELSNNELFTVETQPKEPKKLSSRKAKREKLREAPLKCLSLLQPLTKVPDPIAKRNRVRTKDERIHPFIKQREARLRAKGIYKQKDIKRVKDMRNERIRRAEGTSKFDFSKDLWDVHADDTSLLPRTKTAAEISSIVTKDEWIAGNTEHHIIHGPGRIPKAVHKSLRKKPYDNVLKAVEMPHPGMSYNPSYEDHQTLLKLIVEKEEKLIKEEKHLKRVTQDMFKKVTASQRDANWMVEMSEGLKPDTTNETIPNDDEEYKTINPPVKNKEKSHQQRRKKKEQQQLREQLRQAKIEKKKISDMYRLRFINKEIGRASQRAQVLHEKRMKKKEHHKSEAKRLGVNKFEEPDLEFNLTKDISGNLRNVKKAGNLLSDRFKSLQKRNYIEPTVVNAKKWKPKTKKFTKPGHKEDTWKAGLSKKLS